MGTMARTKSANASPSIPVPTIASATRIFIPENRARAVISGSTTIATIQCDKIRLGRSITLIWAASATAGVTDTAVGTTVLAPNTTTANICLSGSIIPAQGTNLTLTQDIYGQWQESGRSVNG